MILIIATVILASLLLISTAWATPADESTANSSTLGELESQASQLDSSYNEALSAMVAADSEVSRYNGEIDDATQRRGQVQSDIQLAQQRVDELRSQMTIQREALAKRLCTTYKSDDVGYLEVILGSDNFSEFLDRVDLMSMIADEDKQLINSINDVRQSEEEKLTTLSQKQEELDSLIVELGDARTNLVDAQADRQATVAEIETQMQSNQEQLTQLQAEAAAIETRMDELQTAAEDTGSDDTPPPAGGTSMTMTATAYCMAGTTATGMPVGRGVIAVDPSVIPLGTSVYVSGYGDAIAADIGGAITGNTIDVWLPCGEAYAWGTRTVEVTVY